MTCVATCAQTAKLLGYGRAAWRRRALKRAIFATDLALGRRAYAAGQGDSELRRRIEVLDEEILTVEAAKRPIGGLRAKRNLLCLELAASTLAQMPADPAIMDSIATARDVRLAAQQHETAIIVRRADLFPKILAHRCRIAAGYSVAICLMLVGFALIFRSGSPSGMIGRSRQLTTSQIAVDQKQSFSEQHGESAAATVKQPDPASKKNPELIRGRDPRVEDAGISGIGVSRIGSGPTAIATDNSYLKQLLDDPAYGKLNRHIALEIGVNLDASRLGREIGTLNLLAKRGKLPEEKVLEMFEQAVNAAASNGLSPAPVFALDTIKGAISWRTAYEEHEKNEPMRAQLGQPMLQKVADPPREITDGYELDPQWIPKRARVERDEKALGRPIIKISFYGTGVTDAGLRNIKDLKNLKSLDLCYTKVTDVGISNLKDLKNLQSLNLSWTQVTNTGLSNLKDLKNLQSLDLGGHMPKVTDAGLKNLKELKNLQSLSLHGNYTVTIAGLEDLKSLRTLDLGATPANDADLKNLKELKNLQSLNLSYTDVTDGGLKALTELENLDTLDLSQTHVTDVGLRKLAALKNLQSLNLSHNTNVTGAELKALNELKSLRSLDLYDNRVGDTGLQNLKELKSLQSLRLGNNLRITDAGLKNLNELMNLKDLDLLGNVNVTDAGLGGLRNLRNLQRLDISHTQVTDAVLKELKELQGLEWLNLNATAVTDAGLEDLKVLKNLQFLNLRSTKVQLGGVNELKRALPKCQIL